MSLANADGDGLYVIEEAKNDPNELTYFAGSFGWATVRRVDPSGSHAVTTVAGVTGGAIGSHTPETDGFGPNSRFANPHSAVVVDRVLYIGEEASIRAVNLDSGQVSTAAGLLHQEYLFHNLRAVAAQNGALYAATRTGDLLQLSATRSTAPVKISRCKHPSGYTTLDLGAIVVDGDQLFYLDQDFGICRVYLEGKDDAGKPAGQAGCLGCKGTWERVYPAASLTGTKYTAAQKKRQLWQLTGMAHARSAKSGARYLYLLGRNADYERAQKNQTGHHAGVVHVDAGSSVVEHLELPTPLPRMPWGIVHNDDKLYVTGAIPYGKGINHEGKLSPTTRSG